MEVIKGDTSSLDYSSYDMGPWVKEISFCREEGSDDKLLTLRRLASRKAEPSFFKIYCCHDIPGCPRPGTCR